MEILTYTEKIMNANYMANYNTYTEMCHPMSARITEVLVHGNAL